MTILLAQAYGCGAYGTETYNNCTTETPSTSGGNTNSSTGTSSSTDNAGTRSSDAVSGTSEETQSSLEANSSQQQDGNGTKQPATTTQQRQNDTPAEQIAATSWNWLLPIILVIAILFAGILFAIKRRGRNNDQTPPPAIGF